MRSPLSPLAGIAALALLGAPAAGDSLTPAQVLRITFTVDNNFSPGPPDVLSLNFGTIDVISAFTTRHAAIYNGATHLGTHSNSLFGGHVGLLNLDPSNAFVSATSLYTFLTPAIIDFTSILDGSIVGRMDFSIQTGEVDIPLHQVNLRFLRSTGPSGGTIVTPVPTLLSVEIVDPAASTGTDYCFGDGSGTACPCGNSGGPGEGCANSTGSGATLAASGSASVVADDLGFGASNLLPGQPALLFVGTNATSGGAGAVFGDGLRCAGQNVVRLGVRIPDGAGQASWGPGLSGAGGWNPGDDRFFQCWYRNPVGSPCGANFNLTQGIEVNFTL